MPEKVARLVHRRITKSGAKGMRHRVEEQLQRRAKAKSFDMWFMAFSENLWVKEEEARIFGIQQRVMLRRASHATGKTFAAWVENVAVSAKKLLKLQRCCQKVRTHILDIVLFKTFEMWSEGTPIIVLGTALQTLLQTLLLESSDNLAGMFALRKPLDPKIVKMSSQTHLHSAFLCRNVVSEPSKMFHQHIPCN